MASNSRETMPSVWLVSWPERVRDASLKDEGASDNTGKSVYVNRESCNEAFVPRPGVDDAALQRECKGLHVYDPNRIHDIVAGVVAKGHLDPWGCRRRGPGAQPRPTCNLALHSMGVGDHPRSSDHRCGLVAATSEVAVVTFENGSTFSWRVSALSPRGGRAGSRRHR